jgi:hypothetical protein
MRERDVEAEQSMKCGMRPGLGDAKQQMSILLSKFEAGGLNSTGPRQNQ